MFFLFHILLKSVGEKLAEVVYWMESEACGFGSGINCYVYPRSAAMCVFALAVCCSSLVIAVTQQGSLGAPDRRPFNHIIISQSGFKCDNAFT